MANPSKTSVWDSYRLEEHTMRMIDTLKQRVRKAGPQARTALVSECAERVYPLYEEMWWGSYYVAVRRGIEMGWNFGCGLPIDAELKARYLEHVLDAVTFFNEDATQDSLLAKPLTVALRVLESMVEDEEQSCLAVARGLVSTLSSAQTAEGSADRHTPRPHARARVVSRKPSAEILH